LPIQEATAIENSDNEDTDSTQDSSGSHAVASVIIFAWGTCLPMLGKENNLLEILAQKMKQKCD
jgi:hypothetical protein